MSMHPSEYSTTHLIFNVIGMLFFAGVGVWFIRTASERGTAAVRTRVEWGYAVKDPPAEVATYTRRARIWGYCLIALAIIGSFGYGFELMRRL